MPERTVGPERTRFTRQESRRPHTSPPAPFPRLGDPAVPAAAARLGGKGATLHSLLLRGLPVPAGVVVPVDRHAAALERDGTRAALERLARALDAPDPLGAARHAAAEPPLASLLAEVDAGLDAALGTARSEGGRRRFAVRSSAPLEDGREHSFAGVLESFVEVPRAGVGPAVLLCWASACSPRFRSYCRSRGIPYEQAALGVVVQEMVAARASGVLMTHDPVTGRRGPLIEAGHGPDSVPTAGGGEPDGYRREEGGWRLRTGGGRAPGRAALSGGEPDTLAGLGERVEALLGAPQDIEWAIEQGSGRAWLLQARPITAAPSPGPAPGRVWTRANLKELYPEIPSPLTRSLIERYQSTWLVDQFSGLGFDVEAFRPSMRVVRGRLYINRSMVDYLAACAGVRGASVGDGIGSAGSCSEGNARPALSDWRSAARRAGPFARLLGAYLTAPLRARRALARAAIRTRGLARARGEDRDDRALLERVLECFQAQRPLAETAVELAGAIHVCTLAASALLRGRAESAAGFLTAVLTGPGSASARDARALTGLVDAAREEGVRERLGAWREGDGLTPFRGTQFGEALSRFLAESGHRAIHESDSAEPRFSEDPGPLIRSLRGAALAGPADGERPGARRAGDAWRELRARLTGWERFLPARVWLLRGLVALLRPLYADREAIRGATTRLVAEERRWALALGARWRERGWLDAAADIFWLRVEEMESLLDGGGPGMEPPAAWLRDRAADHRRRHAAWAARPMPDTWIEGEPAAGDAEAAPPDALLLRGLPLSPGVAEAEVAVLNSPEQGVPAGRILVLPVIGPAWAALLTGARGLVIEMGGLLSHGSILAREFGLPAVVNVPGATERLRNGERVRLDGTRGLVTRLDGEGPARERPEEEAPRARPEGGEGDAR